MTEPEIIILLSLYNGRKYIVEQIYSILSQEDCFVRLIVRDDGSTDDSLQLILSEFGDRLVVLQGKNVGCVDSFSALLEYAVEFFPQAQYFGFSDQDDYWLEEKLSVAINYINGMKVDIPSLYFSNMEITDEELNSKGLIRNYALKIKRGNALLDGRAAGCTMVFNRSAARAYLSHKPICQNVYHDYWMYLICVYFGKVTVDDKSYIKYRQHSSNTLGAHGLTSHKIRCKQFLSFWFGRRNEREKWHSGIEFFRNSFSSELSESDKRVLDTFIRYRQSLIMKVKLLGDDEFTPIVDNGKTIRERLLLFLRVMLNRL